MIDLERYRKVQVLVVGAGPAGLTSALCLKKARPEIDVCVIDKAEAAGFHCLSGAVLEAGALEALLSRIPEEQRKEAQQSDIFQRRVHKDEILMLLGDRVGIGLSPLLHFARFLGLSPGDMLHSGDYIVSISDFTRWLGSAAEKAGVEILYGLAADEVVLEKNGRASAVRLVEQGRDRTGEPQPNYLPGEVVMADVIVLAEGCDGFVTEKFITAAGLEREARPLFSLGVKELIRVSDEQYARFTNTRVIHAFGYPLWTPLLGHSMFGGGIMYAYGGCHIAVGIVVGLDWQEHDFNPQDALTHFKNHRCIKKFIEGGLVVEAGAKMIPEGGFYALPRDAEEKTIGKSNVVIIGDAAGFVNMRKIKGLHLAIRSGMLAAEAIAESLQQPRAAARLYTDRLEHSSVMEEMRSARNYRQTVAKFGNLLGLPLSVFSTLLPRFAVRSDYLTMRNKHYRHKGNREFDKDRFTALAHTQHREDQPVHLHIVDPAVCRDKCAPQFNRPCIVFCPAGVYEDVKECLVAANPSNCLHCKTCQRKCPFDNIRWAAPEGGGGPRYKRM